MGTESTGARRVLLGDGDGFGGVTAEFSDVRPLNLEAPSISYMEGASTL